MKHRLTFIALAASLFHVQIGAADVSRATVVKFNTICGRCHEGECSGRLSFSSGVAAAQSHVRRYIPSSSPLEVEELFAILKYTKEDCAHYPLPDTVPADGVWGVDALQQLRSPDGESHFIPLGKMRRGVYSLVLRFDGKTEASVRITSEKFDLLLEEQQSTDHALNLMLSTPADGRYYLHLKSSSNLLGLMITPAH